MRNAAGSWKSACVYQIYPISFFDSNGDGIGDLPGILSKVDYIKDLGVDVIWFCPIYKSPLVDNGYDISDYRSIDERYGTLEDWDRLAEAAHARDIRIHEWFKESRSSKLNPKRDWYPWRPPRLDEEGNKIPPNNWRSSFEGLVWNFDEATEEYYLHLYAAQQPDLNWDNPDVREAIYDTMRFWLDRGCDGFRLDVINKISKVEGLPDAPITEPDEEWQIANQFFVNGPKVHTYIHEMNSKVLSQYDVMTVGETPSTYKPEDVAGYVLPKNKELNMVFQFDMSELGRRAWTLQELKGSVTKWQQYGREEGFWTTVFMENHDIPRTVSRYGNDSAAWRGYSAKLIAMLQTTQSGTLFVYQGEEIGMKNFPASWPIEEYKDITAQRRRKQELDRRKKEQGSEDVDMSDVLESFQRTARDHARTPVQWTSGKHGGFTSGTPWMRANDDCAEGRNVEAELKDTDSVLVFWRKALSIRKTHETLIYGDFYLLLREHPTIFAYTRSLANTTMLVVLNFSELYWQTTAKATTKNSVTGIL
ncbi:glycoside hydrolase family 13 protein [Phlebiopsis gigantea 11061_1 CR5-6]|uniref:Glycoside hydrolase family 13 protein n=1 Tax=Phlebiopsis gigantea (strain 11061_1 CR5-6) TaxID=745531 RepID=A0A0C3S4Y9_PHLG1|nr:glycoside hydrolase family 13 protein [Phlebiopsis gigantea 11061_1 CR5-6]